MTGSHEKPIARTWVYIVAIGIMFAFGTAIFLLRSINHIREERRLMAISQADIISQMILATRQCSMETGGAFSPVAQTPQGNEDGKLVKISHIALRKLLQDVLSSMGLKAHMVGLDTSYPQDNPDRNWERVSFDKLVKGSEKEYALTGTAGNQVFHYIFPLKIDAGCIRCHEKNGYRIGEVRNAISIEFPYTLFEQSARRSERREIGVHLLFITLALGILFFLGRRIVQLTQSVQEVQKKVHTLEGILPMCMNCKKIRKEGAAAMDQAGWIPVADYIRDCSEAKISHGFCPECMEKLYGPGGSLTEG